MPTCALCDGPGEVRDEEHGRLLCMPCARRGGPPARPGRSCSRCGSSDTTSDGARCFPCAERAISEQPASRGRAESGLVDVRLSDLAEARPQDPRGDDAYNLTPLGPGRTGGFPAGKRRIVVRVGAATPVAAGRSGDVVVGDPLSSADMAKLVSDVHSTPESKMIAILASEVARLTREVESLRARIP